MVRHRCPAVASLALGVCLVAALAAPASAQTPAACERMIEAHVVALDQVFFWNRFGAVEPQGMIYALERDVVHVDEDEDDCDLRDDHPNLAPGQVRLRKTKRPRPLVLRMNVGDCLKIHFTNLLDPSRRDAQQPATREASIHVTGMQYVVSDADGGMWVADGPNGLAAPGESRTYTLYAEKEGTFLMYSGAAMTGGEGYGGTISTGLFGAINVEPRGSRWFRSQVTHTDFALATIEDQAGVAGGFPRLDYGAVYTKAATAGHPDVCWRREGTPILEMLQGNEIVHSDLTAIITGPQLAGWPEPPPAVDNVYPHRNEPFREFTAIFHDELGAVQAFPEFNDEILSYTLDSVIDGFAINYGTAAVGAEILANRFGVGPAHSCVDCKYEEFFLSAWAGGDPAMVVDVPANFPCGQDSADPSKIDPTRLQSGENCRPDAGPKATRALYPDDPSNVYHSYLADHVKFRNLHAGTDDHHIFHLHAHQWLHDPDSDESEYLDSQAIGQGSSFTYEIAHEGGGNRNRTAGDSIFHCHFYPHFAQGMWSLWRVHDVLETGTELDLDGRPVHHHDLQGNTITDTRALPDGEIAAGTPIPAIVPLPSKAMAPLPAPVRLVNGQIDRDFVTQAALETKANGSPFFSPGYPFFIPGIAGSRAPHPPLDFAVDENGQPRDGGLPRHVVLGGEAEGVVNRLDFHKHVETMRARWLPEEGTTLEKLAMEFHARPGYLTPSAGGPQPRRPIEFNGLPAVPGAPYADPCRNDDRATVSGMRTYQAVDMELDVVFNKEGWHFPQQRILTLREDWLPTKERVRPPEPMFLRANSRECIHYELTNLVPYEYQTDDFQVRTPTDILGQHIHLVKFDVTSSDGGANGFNYEDGSFSPEEVQERISAIRAFNDCDALGIGEQTVHPATGELFCPVAKVDPRFGQGEDKNCNGFPDYLGAQTTVQRWWADPVEDNTGNDRTLRTVFTHDHFSPSTHQQAGLYAGVVVEPDGSTWWHNEREEQLGVGREDGGPTSWAARIRAPNANYREFMIEFADFQLAYEPNEVWKSCPDPVLGWADPKAAINPPGRRSIGPHELYVKPDQCPVNHEDVDGSILGPSIAAPSPPCPEAVSADDPGYIVVNYRNEPLGLRLSTPTEPPQQARGLAGDPSFAYESRTDRARAEFNKVPDGSLAKVPYPTGLTGGLEPGDPFTPILRAFEGDPIQIRTLVGAHEEEHSFVVHGVRWLREPENPNSGFRNAQMMGLSEKFEIVIPAVPGLDEGSTADFLYKPSAATEWQWDGAWGIMRLYRGSRTVPDLAPLINANPVGKVDDGDKSALFDVAPGSAVQPRPMDGPDPIAPAPVMVGCPAGTVETAREYDITVVAAREALPYVPSLGMRTLVYNAKPASMVHREGEENAGLEDIPPGTTFHAPLHDPTAMLFVMTEDLVFDGVTGRPRLAPDAPVEPIILRARAGECIKVTLRNALPAEPADPAHPGWAGFGYDLDGWNAWHMIIENFNANDVRPSLDVGLHAQLVSYDPKHSDGNNVGLNPKLYGKQTVAPGEEITYFWYAGHEKTDLTAFPPVEFVPVEFGVAGLTSSDPLEHTSRGLIGALVIEPAEAEWALEDRQRYLPGEIPRRTRAEATVLTPDGDMLYREFVTVIQDDVNMRFADASVDAAEVFKPVPSLISNEDPTESAQKGINYRTEPLWLRKGFSPESGETENDQLADSLVTLGPGSAPVTHVFNARPADPIRFRVVRPGGHTQAHVFEVQGHIWPEYPHRAESTEMGAPDLGTWEGVRSGMGPGAHENLVLTNGAGGKFRVNGTYVYRDYVSWGFADGIWGFFEVYDDARPLETPATPLRPPRPGTLGVLDAVP